MAPSGTARARVTTEARAISDLVNTELPIAAGICVVAGEVLALGSFPSIAIALAVFFAGFFTSGFAMSSNDYFCLDVEKINHQDRPLPSGRVTVRELTLIAGLFSVAGFVAAAFLGPLPLALAVILWAVSLLYNWKWKGAGLLGNMMVSSSVAMTFVFGGVAMGEVTSGVVWTFGALAFLFNLGEEIAGGAMDVRGDERRVVRSLARMKGRKFAMRVTGVIFASFVGLTIIPCVIGWLGRVYLVLVLIEDAAVLYLLFRLLRSQTAEEGRAKIRQLYLTMVFFVIVFTASRLL